MSYRIIRVTALSLIFKYPRREGIFDGLFFGEAVKWVVELEEKHRKEGQVPGWARIRRILGKLVGSAVRLRCFQRTSATSDEVVERGTAI
jgi:hypothetical protein